MEDADLAVSAAGQALSEACCTGLPVLAICVAENQQRHAEALSRPAQSGLPGWHGDERLWGTLALAGASVVRSRQALSDAGRRLIDGKGTSKVIADLLGWSRRFSLRPAGDGAAKIAREVNLQKEHSSPTGSSPAWIASLVVIGLRKREMGLSAGFSIGSKRAQTFWANRKITLLRRQTAPCPKVAR